MQFVLGIPLMQYGHDHAFLDGDAIGEYAAAAEKAGFDAVSVTEHPIPNERWLGAGGHNAFDPFVELSFAAAATSRLRLLTNITVVTYRNPFLLAKSAASLDRLSKGRLILGAAAGYLKSEFFALGVDFDERNDLFDESLEVLRLTWSGEPVTYEGRHFSARDARALPRPAQDPLPIWIGGNSRLSLRRVAEKAEGWLSFYSPPTLARTARTARLETMDDLAQSLAYLREHAERVGRTKPIDVSSSALTTGAPGTRAFDPNRSIEEVQQLTELGVTWYGVGGFEGERGKAMDAAAQFGEEVIARL